MTEWIYESPDKGKTYYRRKVGDSHREIVDKNCDVNIDDLDIDELMVKAIEEKASKLEITCDYYMEEFM